MRIYWLFSPGEIVCYITYMKINGWKKPPSVISMKDEDEKLLVPLILCNFWLFNKEWVVENYRSKKEEDENY